MRRAASLALCLTLLGPACRSVPPSAPAGPPRDRPAPPPLEHAEAAFREKCVPECEQQNAMRAVAAEMIRAECEATCADEWTLPVVARASDLEQHDAFRVRVTGTLAPSPDGTASVELIGGATVRLEARPTEAPLPVWGRPVVVVGTLILGAGSPRLEGWTTLVERSAPPTTRPGS